MTTLAMTIEELVDNFSFLDDWEDRYAYLIELGRALPPMDEAYKTDETKVEGCTSQVWLKSFFAQNTEGKRIFDFYADSDAHIVRGLVAVVRVMYAGKTPEEITSIDHAGVFTELGLETHLTPNRRNGLNAMVQRIRLEAAA